MESLEGDPASEGRGLIPGDSGRRLAHGLGDERSHQGAWVWGLRLSVSQGWELKKHSQNSQKSWLYFAACFKFFKTSALLRYS